MQLNFVRHAKTFILVVNFEIEYEDIDGFTNFDI